MEKTANAQVAIETQLNGTTLEGVIHVDFTSDFGSQVYFVTLFVVENGIPAIAQQNYYNNRSGSENHPYFGRPSCFGPR